MALYGLRVQIIGRSDGRSAIAAASYRSGEKLWDERQQRHCHKQRTDVERSEILLPDDAPLWARQADREVLWNAVERGERRKDAQLCRDLRIQLPREFDQTSRHRIVREFVRSSFVSRGMAADIAWHRPSASDGEPNPHAHVMLTMRPFTETGFGKKSRHEMVPDPEGRTHPDGRPLLVPSNPLSWNDAGFYEKSRENWQHLANAELARIGSSARIDRRSYVERGIACIAQPMLGLSFHMRKLYGSMRDRWGVFQAAKHYTEVEQRAQAALDMIGPAPNPSSEQVRTVNRYVAWIERQIERLAPHDREAADRAPSGPELSR